MSDITGALVIDSGSGFIKAGLAKNDFPTVCMPNVLLERTEGTELEKGKRWFGAQAIRAYKESELSKGKKDKEMLELKRPNHRGQITDWDTQELIW